MPDNFSLEDDGTLVLELPVDILKVGRVLVIDTNSEYCGMFYPDNHENI